MAEKTKQHKCILAVRVRGTVSASREARETLQMLHLLHNNYATLLDDRPSFLGMLKTAQNFVTWGEASKETLSLLIKKKGRLTGNKRLSDDCAKAAGFTSLEDLVKAVFNGRADYWKLPSVSPIFRLHPPIKGFRGKTKKGFGAGGELGYRGEKINELVGRML